MFTPTKNPYSFKFLVTGITGEGIPCVYLPEVPKDQSKIHFKKENKWVRPEPSLELRGWMREMLAGRERVRKDNLKREEKGEEPLPDYIHTHQEEINAWEDKVWDWTTNGMWFWNKGVPTFITPFYCFYLLDWKTYFGRPEYRETDKEITYWIQYLEEDPDCFGGAFNTIRRYGKSVLLGAWSVFRTIRNRNHFSGMQGETDEKIKKFYNKFVKKPFYKLSYYFQPTYNLDTKQTTQIEFDLPPRRNQKRSSDDEVESLESIIEYRASGEGEFDGDILNTYLCEEPGKLKKTSLYNNEGEGRWDIVQPCLMDGLDIIGKALMGTTVENLNITDKGGAAYKALFYDSNFDDKQADGRTKSGLYTAFLPGDCALKGFWDEWGFPKREEARFRLVQRRDSFKKNASKLAGQIRKYPLSIKEIFYVNPDSCEFNSLILQDNLRDIDTTVGTITRRIDLYWQDNKRDTKVLWRDNPNNGWCQVCWLPDDLSETNKVEKYGFDHERNIDLWRPMNYSKFAAGGDPIEHGVVGYGGLASKPVIMVKRKYDSAIDGYVDQQILEQRAEAKFPYKTNRYVLMYDKRPTDPNKFFEYAIMICVFFGIPIHFESQKNSIINYFYERGYGDFILNKYQPVNIQNQIKGAQAIDGTAASPTTIQDYTSALSTWVDYFGHTQRFRECTEDNLIFKPSETKIHDYTVAMGYCELACKMKPKTEVKALVNIEDFMPTFDRYGNVTN